MEDSLFIPEVFFKIIRMVALTIFIFAFSIFLYSILQSNQINLTEKAAIETANSILRDKNLVVEDGIFDPVKLNDRKPNVGCNYQYEIIIENDDKEWIFNNSFDTNIFSSREPGSDGIETGEAFFPATFKTEDGLESGSIYVKLFDTELARLYCSIEIANLTKGFDYYYISFLGESTAATVNTNSVVILQKGENVCFGEINCVNRNGIKINDFRLVFEVPKLQTLTLDEYYIDIILKMKVFSTDSTSHDIFCNKIGKVTPGDRVAFCLENPEVLGEIK